MALEPGPRATVFFGHNGQGKTNLLEAAHYLVEFRSFRTRTPTELVGWQAPEAKLAAEVEVGRLTRRIDVQVGAQGAPARKQVRVDGKGVRRDSPQLRGLGVVVFLPEDLLLPRAAPVGPPQLPGPRRLQRRPPVLRRGRRLPEGAAQPQRWCSAGAPPTRPCWPPTTSSWRAPAPAW